MLKAVDYTALLRRCHVSFKNMISETRWQRFYALNCQSISHSRWRYQMGTFSPLLALCAGNSLVTGEFPSQRPVTRSFDVFFDLRLNKRLSKQSWGWWFVTQSRPLWRRSNVMVSFKQRMCKADMSKFFNGILPYHFLKWLSRLPLIKYSCYIQKSLCTATDVIYMFILCRPHWACMPEADNYELEYQLV